MGRRMSGARVKVIFRRQRNPLWDETYLPSILATPQEAPSHSSPSIITYEKFGREIHLLSKSEMQICIFALYHPNTIGLQEQRILSPVPAMHPLWTFEGIDKLSLNSIKGTIDVAERLGFEKYISKIRIKNKLGQYVWVTIPLIGDLLILQKEDDEISCINWSIKGQVKDFHEIEIYQFDKINRNNKPLEKALARHQIEKVYYEDIKIRTHFIGGDQIDRNVLHNLRHTFLYHRRCKDLLKEQRAEIFHYFQTAFHSGIAPLEVIRKFDISGKYSPEQSKSVLFQSIWQRKIQPDLFQPIMIDRPLKPQKLDVLDVYAGFFERNV